MLRRRTVRFFAVIALWALGFASALQVVAACALPDHPAMTAAFENTETHCHVPQQRPDPNNCHHQCLQAYQATGLAQPAPAATPGDAFFILSPTATPLPAVPQSGFGRQAPLRTAAPPIPIRVCSLLL